MEIEVYKDYQSLMPIHEIAAKHHISIHEVVKIANYFMVIRPLEIANCKEILEEFEIW
jgi:hypothetical protein